MTSLCRCAFKHSFIYSLFILGIVGDWKNHFTVTMKEDFERLYSEKMADIDLSVVDEQTEEL